MFGSLLQQLEDDIVAVDAILLTSETLRSRLFSNQESGGTESSGGSGSDHPTDVAEPGEAPEVDSLRIIAPEKLDWQIYDHCAAVTRLYAAYERFVSELVSEYIRILPELFGTYPELPKAVVRQHRIGIGHILLKMGKKGPYKDLEDSVIVHEFSRGLSGQSGYSLLPNAFFVSRENLRFGTLIRLFGSLGFKSCESYINKHPAVATFLRDKRGDEGTAQKELDDLVEYRNEASHRRVQNILGPAEIQTVGKFTSTLARVLAGMVEEFVLKRKIALKRFAGILTVSEICYGGTVVIGKLERGGIKVGDEVVLSGHGMCKRTTVQSVQIEGQPATEDLATGTEVGLKLDCKAKVGDQLLEVEIPGSPVAPLQLHLEEAPMPMVDEAEPEVGSELPGEVGIEGPPSEPGSDE